MAWLFGYFPTTEQYMSEFISDSWAVLYFVHQGVNVRDLGVWISLQSGSMLVATLSNKIFEAVQVVPFINILSSILINKKVNFDFIQFFRYVLTCN